MVSIVFVDGYGSRFIWKFVVLMNIKWFFVFGNEKFVVIVFKGGVSEFSILKGVFFFEFGVFSLFGKEVFKCCLLVF